MRGWKAVHDTSPSENGTGEKSTVVPDSGEVTRLLGNLRGGDQAAHDELYPLVYGELRRVAQRVLSSERAGHTLQATALVNEAYLKLAHAGGAENRLHFIRIAARAMRQVLVDHARRKLADKRGGDVIHTVVDDKPIGLDARPEELMALDQALERLEKQDPRLRQIVECRFFGGLTEGEMADLLGVTTRTVQRDWAKARAWLYRELYQKQPPAEDRP